MQTVGVFAATVMVAKLLRTDSGPNRYLFSCVAVSAVVSLVLFFTAIDRGIRQMREDRRTVGSTSQPFCNGAPCRPYLQLTSTEATDQVGARMGVSTPFIEWVKARLRPGDSYYLVMTTATETAAFPLWITYRLLPNLATGIEGQLGNGTVRKRSASAVGSADWVIFYAVDARNWLAAGGTEGRLEKFTPTLGVLRRRK
jgi:hypothetical protein